VGVLLIGLSLTELPRIAHGFGVAYSEFGGTELFWNSSLKSSTWTWLAGSGLRLAVGVFLVLRASNLASALRRGDDPAPVATAGAQCPHCGSRFDPSDYRPGAAAYLCGDCKQELPRALIETRDAGPAP